MKLFLILGNQLFNPKYLNKFSDHTFYMAEDLGLCTFQKHHKLKILLFLSSMRSFKDELKSKKFNIIYKDCHKDFNLSYEKKLERTIKDKKINEVSFFEIEDIFFEKRIKLFFKKKNIKFNEIKSPMFITSRMEFKKYLESTKKPFMANFYKINRSKTNILMNKNGTPKGGKWSFDEDNRKKLPDKIVKTKIDLFGDYEDAVSKKSNILFHSALSPLINIGLITPGEIIEKVKKVENKVRINSLEGYIRQVIGWREFMRGIYQNYDKRLDDTNFFNHKNKMKASWYNGTTGLDPLDHSIIGLKEYQNQKLFKEKKHKLNDLFLEYHYKYFLKVNKKTT